MTGAGIRFAERMAGTLTDVSGACTTPAALRGTVTVADLERFLNDPDHRAALDGAVRIEALAPGWLQARGEVRLFSMGAAPGERRMEYRMEFQHGGARHALAGVKHVRDDPGFDAWRDVTTLSTSVVRYAPDGAETQLSSGTLRLSLGQAARLVVTLRGTGNGGLGAQLRAMLLFSLFFLCEIAARYWPVRPR